MSKTERNSKKRHKKIGVRFSTIIYTLFGIYIIPRGVEAHVADLVELVRPLGLSANATRLGLSRMSRHGVFRSRKVGRHSYYSLSKKGMEWMESGRVRAFEVEHRKWDGRWRFVVYGVPEKLRSLRDKVRGRLDGLGFAPLSASVWISPHDLRSEIVRFVAQMKMTGYVEMFEAKYTGLRSAKKFANGIWDIDGLERRYRAFFDKYKNLNAMFERLAKAGTPISPAECFAERFCMTAEYVALRLEDPMLPLDLLPANWIGLRAQRLHDELWARLKRPANDFVDSVLRK